MTRKLSKKSATKWAQRETLSLHEAVCLALDQEPEGTRPAKPSARYLEAEKWIMEKVPPVPLAPVDEMRQLLRALGTKDLDAALKDFAELPASEQEIALAAVKLSQARTADEVQQMIESEPLRSLPEERRARLIADLVHLLPH